MNQVSTETNHNNINNKKDQVEWRRNKVQELLAKGNNNHYEIASILQVSRPTISRDIHYLKQLARDNITKYIDHELPFEYDKCLAALNSLQKKAWEISEGSNEEKTKVQALSLAKECVINKLDLLTNATVVEDAIRFVQDSKLKLKLSFSGREESKEPDYNNSHDKELEEKHPLSATKNEIF